MDDRITAVQIVCLWAFTVAIGILVSYKMLVLLERIAVALEALS